MWLSQLSVRTVNICTLRFNYDDHVYCLELVFPSNVLVLIIVSQNYHYTLPALFLGPILSFSIR